MVDLRTQRPNLGEPSPPRYVRVKARDENIRKYIKHPAGNLRFRSDINEYVEWPWDAFTQRRIKKGEVIVEEKKEEPKQEEAKQQPQQQRQLERSKPSESKSS